MPKIIRTPECARGNELFYDELVREFTAELKGEYGLTLCTADFAKYMGCHRETAQIALKVGEVPFVTLGREKRFRALDIARYLAQRQIVASGKLPVRGGRKYG